MERSVITGMVVHERVCAMVASKWDGELFASRWANVVAGWCVVFFAKHGKAPGKSIASMYARWAAKQADESTADLVGDFLSSLSDEYEELAEDLNPEHVIDLAGELINEVRLRRVFEQGLGDLEVGRISEAEDRVATYGRVELGAGAGVNVLDDDDALKAAFEDKQESLVRYPGALGELFGNNLHQDGLFAFLGPEKRGKTFWLMDMAWRAMLQRKRVAVFSVGDMSQNQMMRRFVSRAAKAPLNAGRIAHPTKLTRDDEGKAVVEHEDHIFEHPLSWQAGREAFGKAMRKVRSKNSYMKLSCHSNSSIDVAGIDAVLRQWEHAEGWVPRVVVIDYADILAMNHGGTDQRDKINQCWKDLRKLSQDRHILVATATQADADSYSRDVLGMGNFSEDKRKLAHVTGMMGLNQTATEKRQGLMRVNWVVLREDEFNAGRCVTVASCLGVARPAVLSL